MVCATWTLMLLVLAVAVGGAVGVAVGGAVAAAVARILFLICVPYPAA